MLTSRRVPHSSREEHAKKEVASDAIVDVFDDGAIEASFNVGADEGGGNSDAEEGLSL